MNSMFLDLQGELTDYFGGKEDLEQVHLSLHLYLHLHLHLQLHLLLPPSAG